MSDDNSRRFPGGEQTGRSSSHRSGSDPVRTRSLRRDSNLGERSGNYLFTFGLPVAGKSTFHCYMMRYLVKGREDLRPPQPPRFAVSSRNPDGDEDNVDGDTLFASWQTETWPSNRFPRRTPAGEDEIRELFYTVKPHNRRDPELTFGFVEASGELLKEIQQNPYSSSPARLSETFRVYMENPAVKMFLILLVSPTQPAEESDRFFHALLSLIEKDFSDRKSNWHIAVVVSDPKSARTALQEHRLKSGDRGFTGNSVEEFVRHTMPATWSHLRMWHEPVKVSPFKLGDVETREIDLPNESGGFRKSDEPFIVKLDLTHCEQIFDQIYKTFTSTPEGKWSGRWRRVLKFMSS